MLDDPEFNAFAAPGGYIFVTKGLTDRVADEAELAGYWPMKWFTSPQNII